MGDLVQTWDLWSSGVETKSGRKAEIIENSNIEIFSLQLVAMLQTLISYETLWYFKDVRGIFCCYFMDNIMLVYYH